MVDHRVLNFTSVWKTILEVKIGHSKLWSGLRFICLSLVTMQKTDRWCRSTCSIVLFWHVASSSTIMSMHYCYNNTSIGIDVWWHYFIFLMCTISVLFQCFAWFAHAFLTSSRGMFVRFNARCEKILCNAFATQRKNTNSKHQKLKEHHQPTMPIERVLL